MNFEEEIINKLIKKHPDKAEKIKLFVKQTKLKMQKKVQKKINKGIKEMRTAERVYLKAKEKTDLQREKLLKLKKVSDENVQFGEHNK